MRSTFPLLAVLWSSAALAQPALPSAAPSEGTGTSAPCWADMTTVYFDFDDVNVRSDQAAVLDQLIACLAAVAADGAQRYVVEVVGHTDERGTEEFNFSRGERCARSVVRYLERGLGDVARVELHARSSGESQPRCPESTEACWRQNRRTEITVEATAEATIPSPEEPAEPVPAEGAPTEPGTQGTLDPPGAASRCDPESPTWHVWWD